MTAKRNWLISETGEVQGFIIEGTPYDVRIRFPLEKGIVFSAEIVDKNGRLVQRIEKPLTPEGMRILSTVRPFLPMIKQFLLGGQ